MASSGLQGFWPWESEMISDLYIPLWGYFDSGNGFYFPKLGKWCYMLWNPSFMVLFSPLSLEFERMWLKTLFHIINSLSRHCFCICLSLLSFVLKKKNVSTPRGWHLRWTHHIEVSRVQENTPPQIKQTITTGEIWMGCSKLGVLRI